MQTFCNYLASKLLTGCPCLCYQVVSSVVRYGDSKLVHPLSLAAAHCMGEVTLSTETRESAHKYPNDTVDKASVWDPKTKSAPFAFCGTYSTSPNKILVFLQGKVHIPGAATLFVKFDPRYVTLVWCYIKSNTCITLSLKCDAPLDAEKSHSKLWYRPFF